MISLWLYGRGGVAKKPQSSKNRGMTRPTHRFKAAYEKITARRVGAALTNLAALVIFATGSALCLSACSSTSDMRLSTEPENAGKNASAHPAAYGISDAFTFGKPQHVRPKNDLIFYYKDCEQTGPQADRAFFSKTAYSCSSVR